MQKNQPLLKFGSVLVSVYGILAFAAIGRSTFELIFKFQQAPIPYSLSIFSALVYLLATVAIAINTTFSSKVAVLAVLVEMLGVLIIGFLSFLDPELFTYSGKPIHTVWSYFGVSYGFVPLVLPFVGFVWLQRRNRK